MGVFKEDGSIIGLIPIELSNPIDYFLIDGEKNFGSGVAVVPKIHEVRLVVPVKFTTITKQLSVAIAVIIISSDKHSLLFKGWSFLDQAHLLKKLTFTGVVSSWLVVR